MKKLTKKILVFALLIICIMSTNCTVYAKKGNKEADKKTETEELVKNCNLTFSLTDKTNGAFINDVSITLFNRETHLEYNYVMQSIDYLFGVTVAGSVEQGAYDIAISYEGKDDFSIVNEDGTEISSFDADNSEYTFKWKVVTKDSDAQSKENKKSSSVKTADTTGDSEADMLWKDFLDKVSVVETDSKYASLLELVGDMAKFQSDYYAKATNRDADEYVNMSDYEQLLWYSTYLLPVNAITSSDYDTYCGSVAKWDSNAVGNAYNWFAKYGSQEMADSYKALMEWDYDYFLKNGAVMNFITGKSSIENEDLEPLSSEDANGNDKDPSKEDIEKLKKELSDDEEKGIWSDTKNLIKKNAGTIIILFILAGITVGIIVYRKRKAIDDETK